MKPYWIWIGILLVLSSCKHQVDDVLDAVAGKNQAFNIGIEKDKKLIEAARELMLASESCALITLDEAGVPKARTMDPFAPEPDLTVWLATNPRSAKVRQIKNDSRVTLYYADSTAQGYVTIQGEAELIDSPEEKAKRWKEGWEAFYPSRSQDYLLIMVKPRWMEVVSYKHGLLGDSITWEAPSLQLLPHEIR